MADALADFFAKKDKKKRGTKVTSSENSRLDYQEQSVDFKSKKENKDVIPHNLLGFTGPINNDEWIDFEENREKDYTGLKIQTLTFKDKEVEVQEQKQLDTLNEKQKDENPQGAWCKNSEPVPKVEEKPEVDAKKTYVPPSMRSYMGMSRGLKKGQAPEITNRQEFPTLG